MPFSTVCDHLHGTTPHVEYQPVAMKLTKLKEATIVECILDLDLRGFLASKAILCDMANKLLAKRDGGTVGINWPNRFIACWKELKTCYTCVYNCQ